MNFDPRQSPPPAPPRTRSDAPFLAALIVLGGTYVVLIVAMLAAQASFTSPGHLWAALNSEEIRYAIKLSLVSCSMTTILALWVAVPIGYLMSRWDDSPIRNFLGRIARRVETWGQPWSALVVRPVGFLIRGLNPKPLIDAILDIPIVLPPLVVGLALLILFQTSLGHWFQTNVFRVTFAIPSVILAQFTVAAAFAVRTMRVTFDQISPRTEAVALTLGCSRAQAFWKVVLPEARRGLLAAAALAWARSLGEFGPILVFSGTTRMRTEVLPTTVYLELQIDKIEAAVAVSLLMVLAAVTVLIILRHAEAGPALGKALQP